jgi:hypothetical protein
VGGGAGVFEHGGEGWGFGTDDLELCAEDVLEVGGDADGVCDGAEEAFQALGVDVGGVGEGEEKFGEGGKVVALGDLSEDDGFGFAAGREFFELEEIGEEGE